MYTGLGKLSIQSEKWRSGVVMFLNVKFCYEIQHFWLVGCVFAATNSDEKPKSIIRAPRSKFVIKLPGYAIEGRTLNSNYDILGV
ncbi:hypothetical protein MICAER10613_039010 [Microcystis aeruginosa]